MRVLIVVGLLAWATTPVSFRFSKFAAGCWYIAPIVGLLLAKELCRL